jgi:hypothetical protein
MGLSLLDWGLFYARFSGVLCLAKSSPRYGCMGKVYRLKAVTPTTCPAISFWIGRGHTLIIQKFKALMELQKLAMGKPTTLSPQTIALNVLSIVEWARKEMDKRDDVPHLERLFKMKDPRS